MKFRGEYGDKREVTASAGSGGKTDLLTGQVPDEQLRNGPLPIAVTVDGAALPPWKQPADIRDSVFELAFVLPDSLVGKPEMRISVEVGRTFRPASDPRDLGVVFGVFEVK